jgi:hypothetical protein
MKRKVLLASRILLSIVAFVAAGSRTEGLSLMVQQISSVGARQWLGLMVGSIVASSPVIAPLSERIALSLTYRTDRVVESRTVAKTRHSISKFPGSETCSAFSA